MNTSKFSIIFMRDDSDVRRMRVTPLFLKVLFFLEILLVICACTGGYFGAHFWLVNKSLNADVRAYKHTIQQKVIELDRLHNMEKLIKSDNKELMSSLMASAKAQKNNSAHEKTINLRKILQKIDKQVFVVTNVQFSMKKQDANLSFDVNKKNENNDLLKGIVHIHLITSSGKVIPIEIPQSLDFEIRRMKQFHQKINVPNSLKINELFAIRISIINSSGEMVFSESYPFYSILV
ncbi:MAG: hypothetical protein WC180_06215 [Candidatus Paceibacterota bacterium]